MPVRAAVMLFLDLLTPWYLNEAAPVLAIGGIRCPVLLIHSTDDMRVRFRHAQQLHAASNRALTTLMALGGHAHVRSFRDPAYSPAILAFFDAHL